MCGGPEVVAAAETAGAAESAKGAATVIEGANAAVAADNAFLASSALTGAEAASAGAVIDAGTGYAVGASAGAAGETGFITQAGQIAKAVSPFSSLASTLLSGGEAPVKAGAPAVPAPPAQAAQAPTIDALRAKNLALYGSGADNTFASGTGGVPASQLNLGKSKLLGGTTLLGA
jgi:hypothetical protein